MSNTLRSGRRDFLKMAGAGTAAALMTPGVATAAPPQPSGTGPQAAGQAKTDTSAEDLGRDNRAERR